MSTSSLSERPSFKAQMHQAREDAIVQAACRLLGEKGFETMTVDEVAASAGIAKASLYKHFSGKDDLCTAAIVHGVQRLLQQVQDMPEDMPALERLQALLRWLLEQQLCEEPPLLPPRHSPLAQAVRSCPSYLIAMGQVQACTLQWIAQAQALGQLRSELPADVVMCALLARASGPMLEMLRERGGYSDAQVVDWAMDACLNGLLNCTQANCTRVTQ
ncbi:TetR/AcrR family transcriptional regulator [Comamonas faecalis]